MRSYLKKIVFVSKKVRVNKSENLQFPFPNTYFVKKDPNGAGYINKDAGYIP